MRPSHETFDDDRNALGEPDSAVKLAGSCGPLRSRRDTDGCIWFRMQKKYFLSSLSPNLPPL